MRPVVKFLTDQLIRDIVSEAVSILGTLGVEVNNGTVIEILGDHGAKIDSSNRRAFIPENLVEQALETAPKGFKLYDIDGHETNDFFGDNVYFTPGSAAINLLDYPSGKMRKPNTTDYIRYVKVVDQLEHIASQSTAFIPADVPEKMSDSYRLYLSLLYGKKPVVTGTFTIPAFEVMKDLQLAVRGSEAALKEKPLTVFSCCPTSPLKWSDVTSQNVIDCGRYFIPIEFISMPLAGFMSPVTLTGTLIQHTAETLSGVVISQLANPGAPMLYGGSPAIFDVRYETTPMGAIETMMIDCAYSEIGKFLDLPTQAYTAFSDAKKLDAQAGFESGMGAVLAGLSGVNNISGPGMLDFESCQSLEKLVVDNEICGMTYRLIEGIEPKEDFPAIALMQELLVEQHLLTAKHSRKYLREEHFFPGPIVDRANHARWEDEGAVTLGERAHSEVQKLLNSYQHPEMAQETIGELNELMLAEAKSYGLDRLPEQAE